MKNLDTPLTLDEMVAAPSIAELQQAYEDKGEKHITEKKFLRAVKRDYSALFKEEFSQAMTREASEEIPFSEVIVDDQRYKLFGVFHPVFVHFTELGKNVKKEIDKSNSFFWEQNLLKRFDPKSNFKYENPIEMADHQYISSLFNFRIGLRAGALLPYALPMGLLKAISMAFYYRTTDTSTYLVEKIQNDHNYKQQLKIFFNMPLDSGYYKEMPVNVDLELRAKSGKFNSVQRRSAYMAEFMKACNHLEAEKKAIVGAKHVAEMKYFLLNGFSERDVVDKAHDDAQLFMGNKEAYQGRVMSPMVSRAIKHTVAGFISGLAVDTAVVYTLSQLL